MWSSLWQLRGNDHGNMVAADSASVFLIQSTGEVNEETILPLTPSSTAINRQQTKHAQKDPCGWKSYDRTVPLPPPPAPENGLAIAVSTWCCTRRACSPTARFRVRKCAISKNRAIKPTNQSDQGFRNMRRWTAVVVDLSHDALCRRPMFDKT